MQKLINVLALSSFLVSAAAVGGGVYIYLNKDPLIEKVKSQVIESIKETLPGALSGGIRGALVQNPTQLIPSPSAPPWGSSETLIPTPQYISIPVLPDSPLGMEGVRYFDIIF